MDIAFLKRNAEKLADDIPGLAYVVIIAAVLLLSKEPTTLDSLAIFVVSWLFFRLGSFVDNLFDLLYKPRIRRDRWMNNTLRWVFLKDALDSYREEAAEALKRPLTGIYAKAKQLFEKSKDWESLRVKLPLEFSKVARTIVIPCFSLLIYRALRHQHVVSLSSLNHPLAIARHISRGMLKQVSTWPFLNWLIEPNGEFVPLHEQVPNGLKLFVGQPWWIIFIVLIIAWALYTRLRILNLRRVYELVSKARVLRFAVCDERDKLRQMLVVNRTVIPVKTILVCGAQACDEQKKRLTMAYEVLQAQGGVDVSIYILGEEGEISLSKYTKKEIKDYRFEAQGERAVKVEVPVVPNPPYNVEMVPTEAAKRFHWDWVVKIDDASTSEFECDQLAKWKSSSKKTTSWGQNLWRTIERIFGQNVPEEKLVTLADKANKLFESSHQARPTQSPAAGAGDGDGGSWRRW